MSSGAGVNKARAVTDSGPYSSTSGQICLRLQVPGTLDRESIPHLLQFQENPNLADSSTTEVPPLKVFPMTLGVGSVGKGVTAVTSVVMADQSNVGTVRVYDTKRNLVGMQANNV